MLSNNSRILIIIPARADSKGLVGKNKLDFCGKPLIQYSFEIATQLGDFYSVETLVSTDDDDIQHMANSFIGDSGYRRPVNLSQDTTSMNDTLNHAINWYRSRKNFDWILLLQPTSPLRTLKGMCDFIDKTLSSTNNEDYCFSTISPTKINKYELVCFNSIDDSFTAIGDRSSNSHRQSSFGEEVFFEDGAGYLSSISFWTKNSQVIIGSKMQYIVTHNEIITDIDDKEGFIISEALFHSRLD
jgi:CMP-N,N'-diacetyllegionaminic acid synthase